MSLVSYFSAHQDHFVSQTFGLVTSNRSGSWEIRSHTAILFGATAIKRTRYFQCRVFTTPAVITNCTNGHCFCAGILRTTPPVRQHVGVPQAPHPPHASGGENTQKGQAAEGLGQGDRKSLPRRLVLHFLQMCLHVRSASKFLHPHTVADRGSLTSMVLQW